MRLLLPFFAFHEEVSPTLQLFRQIDLDKDGLISKEDVKFFLRQFDLKLTKNNLDVLAESFLERCGVGPNGHVNAKQFAHYVHEQDRHLSPIYAQMDRNMQGKVDLLDIQAYFIKLGILIEPTEAKRLLRRIDKNNNDCIEYEEWRKFLLFLPISDLASVTQFWRHGAILDLSVDPVVAIPQFMKHKHALRRDVLQLVAGGTAGVVSRTCTAPIDRLKVMRQVYGYKHKQSGFVEAYRYMLREGGLWSLWRGNLINSIKIAPETAVKYTTYEWYKRLLMDVDEDGFFDRHPIATKFASGSLAGLTAQSVVYPVEVLKTRMCLRKTGQYSSVVDCAARIYRELGIRGFFRGYVVNLVGVIPYAGIELATYEWLKSAYIHRYMSHILRLSPRVFPDSSSASLYLHPPSHIIPLVAATSSMAGIVATYPVALIRAKMQAAFYYSSKPSSSQHTGVVTQHPVTVPSLLRAIWHDDGLIGFYRGLGTNLVKVLPATAISMLTYETIRREVNLGPMGSG
ncbi:calcium binding mitochondrial carrier protein [Echinococcus multilocularis]|uniref:Calcium binding mitochondrial carrier protein n=1 Tax=Echinococcus multilocularis TaxID=6211 RepID=A0A068XXC6_ECHMU|nr:calcium binding mitochondrial carrier protein [Echinococcus multilocularis]